MLQEYIQQKKRLCFYSNVEWVSLIIVHGGTFTVLPYR